MDQKKREETVSGKYLAQRQKMREIRHLIVFRAACQLSALYNPTAQFLFKGQMGPSSLE